MESLGGFLGHLEVLVDAGQVEEALACLQIQFALMLLNQLVGCLAVFEAFRAVVSFLVVSCDLGVDANFGQLLFFLPEYLRQAFGCLNVISLLRIQRCHGPENVLWRIGAVTPRVQYLFV